MSEATRTPKLDGFVYLLVFGDAGLKVGRTHSPGRRIKEVTGFTPLLQVTKILVSANVGNHAAPGIEAALKRRLKEWRAGGEFYRPPMEVLTEVERTISALEAEQEGSRNTREQEDAERSKRGMEFFNEMLNLRSIGSPPSNPEPEPPPTAPLAPASASYVGVVPFYFDGAQVRTVTIDGVPYFVGKDVADLLDYTNPNRAMKDHCRGVPKSHPLPTGGGVQEYRVLTEADVLRLIVRSKQPRAVEFERWVFEEVLPAIRRTGSYSIQGDPMEILKDPAKVLELLGGYAGRLQIATAAKEEAVNQRDELAAAHDRFASHDGSFAITVGAKTLDVPPKKLFAWMQANGWIYRPGGRGDYVAYQTKIQQGLLVMATHEITKSNGDIQELSRPRLTTKGLDRLAVALGRPKQTPLLEAQKENHS